MAYQPKSYKKFVATAATATLVASAVAPVASASFTDVNSNYTNAVDYLVQHGIANGFTETTFGITADIKRGDAAVMIANALGLDTDAAADQGFTDLNTRVAGAVNAIVEAGIANGKTETTFAPDLPITRQEVAKMLANAYGLTATTEAGFEDVNSNWMPYVSALVEAEVAFGYNDTTFGSTDKVTRGQFALFVYRAEGSPIPAPAVASLDINAEGDEFTLVFGEALPEGADLNYVLENYDIQVNGSAITEAQVEALKLSLKSVSADMKTAVVSHTDFDDLATTLGGTSVSLQIGGKSDVHTFDLVAEVKTVSLANLNEIVVNFSQPIDEDTIANGDFIVNAESVPASAVELSDDMKTATVTLATRLVDGSNNRVIVDGLKTTSDVAVDKYDQVLYFTDEVAPTVTSTKYTKANNTFTINFSEPVVTTNATYTIKDKNGVVTTITPTSSASPVESVSFSTSGLTDGDAYTVTMVGATDLASNYFAGNKVDASFTAGATETVKPTITEVKAIDKDLVQVTFSEKLFAPGTIQVNADATATTLNADTALDTKGDYKVDASGLVYTINVGTLTNDTFNTIEFAGQTDLNGNVITTVEKQFAYVDKVAPVLSATTTNGAVVTLDFDEAVVLPATVDTESALLIAPNGVRYTVTGDKIAVSTTDSSKVEVNLASYVTEVLAGNYTLEFAKDNISDTDGNSAAYKTTFTLSSSADSTKPTVADNNGVAAGFVDYNASAGTITVLYSEAMGSSAINAANYTIDGVQVFESAYFDGTTNKVVLTLKDGAFSVDGTRSFKLQNVADASGNTLLNGSYSENLVIQENTNPALVSAVATAQGVTLTFNEAMDAVTIAEVTAEADFKVLVNGVEKAVTEAALAGDTTGTKFFLDYTDLTPTEFASAITVSTTTDLDVADLNGNLLPAFTSITASK